MLHNGPEHRIDIRLNENGCYFWELRTPNGQVGFTSRCEESKQACFDTLEHVIIKEKSVYKMTGKLKQLVGIGFCILPWGITVGVQSRYKSSKMRSNRHFSQQRVEQEWLVPQRETIACRIVPFGL